MQELLRTISYDCAGMLFVFLDQFSLLSAFCVLSVLILFGKLSVLLFIFY